MSHSPPPDMRIVIDFGDPTVIEAWRSVDDRVMGGVSRSVLRSTASGTAEFTGDLSLDFGGGFASVRSTPQAVDLSWARGIVLRVRGDGRRYRIRMRTDPGFDGPSYQATFPTTDEWTTVRLSFDAFTASFRGRPVPQAGRLDPSKVQAFGLLVADRQQGSFGLEIAWIGAWP